MVRRFFSHLAHEIIMEKYNISIMELAVKTHFSITVRLPLPVPFCNLFVFVAAIGTVAAVDSRNCFHRMALWIGCCNNHPPINCAIRRHRGYYHYNHRMLSITGEEKYCMVNSEAGATTAQYSITIYG
jgi:hypothetical protein